VSLKRREFITLLGSAAAWPITARAQQSERMRRVAILEGGADPIWQTLAAVFRDGLAKLGWIEGRNLIIDLRFAAGDPERIRATSAELVNLAPEVIFVGSGVATRMVQQQTQAIPIVFVGASNSDDTVKNIARPEGNATGFQILYPSVSGK
jgi:putative ABC transport system substrate-binding protein